ncbi:alpha/beta-hydrolase [Wallemia mellicola]|uniref:Alpha/beta-hydrolase n=1 Tax=Wallemia mellicola TaxID=1708541 RepID=A0A4T0NRF2_9BASI|nr:alpha/beta-hydrolase [Wallemia mellicola]
MTSVISNIPKSLFIQSTVTPVGKSNYRLKHLITVIRFYLYVAPLTVVNTIKNASKRPQPATKWSLIRLVGTALARQYASSTFKWSLQPPASNPVRRRVIDTFLGDDLKSHCTEIKKVDDKYYTGECERARRFVQPASSVPSFWIYPKDKPFHLDDIHDEKVLLFLHGGGYISENPLSLPSGAYAVRETGYKCLAVHYRLSDGINAHPAPLQDCTTAYIYLTHKLGVKPSNIAIMGDSAGANAANALLFHLLDLKERQVDVDLPSFVSLVSPWGDMTSTFPSITTNRECDVLPPFSSQSELVRSHLKYAPESIANKYNSPALQESSTFKPWKENNLKVHVQIGEAEILRDEGLAFAHKLIEAGVDVEFSMIEGEVHDAVNIDQKAEIAKSDFLRGLSGFTS